MFKLGQTFISVLFVNVFMLTGLAMAEDQISPRIHDHINDSLSVKNRLKNMGLAHTEITSIEIEANYFSQNSDEPGFENEGPIVLIETRITEQIRSQIRLAFDRLINIEENKIQKTMDWDEFFREAKMIVDLKTDTTKNISIPFVTIIGKQELSTETYDSEMPLMDESDMMKLNRLRGTYAVQFRLGNEVIKGLNSIVLTAFTTGQGNTEYQGDDTQKNKTGGMILISKKITENLAATGNLVQINYEPKAEKRLNWGLVYTNTNKDLKLFFNQSIFNNNPIYSESGYIWTLGLVKQIRTNGKISTEVTSIDNLKKQYSIGYLHQINETVAAGVEVKRDQCVNPNLCNDATYWGGYFEYQWQKDDN